MYLKEENLRTGFKMFDKDGRRKISINKMKQILRAELDKHTKIKRTEINL